MNKFIKNTATVTGTSIYILNEGSISQITISCNTFENNYIVWIENIMSTDYSGSVIRLVSPGNSTIINNSFFNNKGIYGSCIFYEEVVYFNRLNFNNNIFHDNNVIYGGGALYWKSNFQNFFPNKNNTFQNNTASWGNDYSSSPYRFILVNYREEKNKSLLSTIQKLFVIPGEIFSIGLQIVDYYGNDIKKYDGVASIISNINKDFEFLNVTTVILQAKTSEALEKGIL